MSGAAVFLLAATVILSAAGIGLSLFALWRSQCMMASIGAHYRTTGEEDEAASSALRRTVEELSAQVRDLQQQPANVGVPVPRSSLNLSKRSQALRLHRQGESPDRIAAALELPRQEVDLLVKVHRIVISNV